MTQQQNASGQITNPRTRSAKRHRRVAKAVLRAQVGADVMARGGNAVGFRHCHLLALGAAEPWMSGNGWRRLYGLAYGRREDSQKSLSSE